MAEYPVVELFTSINGEGMKAGELAVFVRLRGCNLRCTYCDTAWAYEEDAPCMWMTAEAIVQAVRKTGITNVTLTGGEPLCQPKIQELLARLAAEPDLAVEVETNGSIDLTPFREMPHPPVFTVDYKLPGSGMETQMLSENFRDLQTEDTVKFVISGIADLERCGEIIRQYDLTTQCHVIVSPVYGRINPQEIVAYMKEKQWNQVRLQLQLHKFIWEPTERGV